MAKFFEYALVCLVGVVLFGGMSLLALFLGEWQRCSVARWHTERENQARNSIAGGVINYTFSIIKEVQQNHRRHQRRAMVEDVKEWLMK